MTHYLNFSKMQALGNDFMVINTLSQAFHPHKSVIQQFGDRHYGIGFDQCLLISMAKTEAHDYFYQIYNASGDEVDFCGNGARAAAIYIFKHLKAEKTLRLQTNSTMVDLKILDNNEVELTLPCPKFKPSDIPMQGFHEAPSYVIENQQVHVVHVGNPHLVVPIQSPKQLKNMSIDVLGSKLENLAFFPEKINVSFMALRSKNTIDLRVWERHCGETLACGSGALASAAIARQFYQLDERIDVYLPGGKLQVYWPDIHGPIMQIGPAKEVFEGRIAIP
jgi:diaminopimelate epimerase